MCIRDRIKTESSPALVFSLTVASASELGLLFVGVVADGVDIFVQIAGVHPGQPQLYRESTT